MLLNNGNEIFDLKMLLKNFNFSFKKNEQEEK